MKYSYKVEAEQCFSAEIGTYISHGIVCLWNEDGYPRTVRIQDVTLDRKEAEEIAERLTSMNLPADQMLQTISVLLNREPIA